MNADVRTQAGRHHCSSAIDDINTIVTQPVGMFVLTKEQLAQLDKMKDTIKAYYATIKD